MDEGNNGDGEAPASPGLDTPAIDELKKDKVVDMEGDGDRVEKETVEKDTVEKDTAEKKTVEVSDDEDMELLREEEERAAQEELQRSREATRWWNQLPRPMEGDDSDGDYRSEEDLHSLDSDDDMPNRSRKEFTLRTDWSDFRFTVGLEFATVDLLRYALKEHFIVSDREFRYSFNNREKLKAVCKSPGCGWCLYAKLQRRDNMTFTVTRLVDEHVCSRVFNSRLGDAGQTGQRFLN